MAIQHPQTSLAKLIKRLEVIKSLITLEEESEIDQHLAKLENPDNYSEIDEIVKFIKDRAYASAVNAIDTFVEQHGQITVYIDPEIDALRLELSSLEVTLNLLSGQKVDLEKLILEFSVRHSKELGALIIKILYCRKNQTFGTPKQQEAEQDYSQYSREYEATMDEQLFQLTTGELNELREKYRRASKLCHPDVVKEEQKELATRMFSELSTAYEKNDLTRVSEILENLEKGIFSSRSDGINQKQLLIVEIQGIRASIASTQREINVIKNSSAYNTISSIVNWDEYFSLTKSKLQKELSELEAREKSAG
ncbi:MAG: hypothetical protein BGO55_11725 [Sphingobacteriales bacterium 50-39]|nr:J domain-containing protein [Sphingobacteriales bacterium]OJW54357.1 MAG: hypothetical protein BGO55_11725 [Sphingobacteriales bacterium 50-39]